MKYINISTFGDPEVLEMQTGARPSPLETEVLIKVYAAGVNHADLAQRRGKYPPPPGASSILGLEVAGIVAEVGSDVTSLSVGDRVCALVSGGGYAEFCVAPAVQCLPIPEGLSFNEAAALPETFFTVWTNVFDRAGLEEGEAILIHGASGGIGTTAIQLCAAIGASVFVTAGSDEKCELCVGLGAEIAINHTKADFEDVINDVTEGDGVDVILDIVGGSYTQRNLNCLGIEGRLVQIATLQGRTAEIDLGLMMRKRLTITATTLRSRSVAEKGEIADALREVVWPLLEDGTITPVVSQEFPLEEAAEAHRLMESREHHGKIVLTLD